MVRRRTQIELMYDILLMIQKEKTTTRIMYKVNLSHALLKKYIDDFKNKNLIKMETYIKKNKIYKTYILTKKGMDFCDELCKINLNIKKLEKQYDTETIM